MKNQPRAFVRFNGGEHVSSPLPYERAERVALRGLDPRWGRFAGGMAELVDVATGEIALTLFVDGIQG